MKDNLGLKKIYYVQMLNTYWGSGHQMSCYYFFQNIGLLNVNLRKFYYIVA